jgi:hypothetical protein
MHLVDLAQQIHRSHQRSTRRIGHTDAKFATLALCKDA